jgi:hypothetical protein
VQPKERPVRIIEWGSGEPAYGVPSCSESVATNELELSADTSRSSPRDCSNSRYKWKLVGAGVTRRIIAITIVGKGFRLALMMLGVYTPTIQYKRRMPSFSQHLKIKRRGADASCNRRRSGGQSTLSGRDVVSVCLLTFLSNVSYADQIDLRVQIHPQLLQHLVRSGVDERALVEAIVVRAQQVICDTYPPLNNCPVRFHDLERYSYTIQADISELEDRPGEFGERAVRRALRAQDNPVSATHTAKTVLIVNDLTYCCDPKDEECAANARRRGERIGGCTLPSHSRIVLAIGPAPYPMDDVPGGWLETMAFSLAHEIGHTFGIRHVPPEAVPLAPGSQVERVQLMAARLRRLSAGATRRQPILSNRDRRKFENRPESPSGAKSRK